MKKDLLVCIAFHYSEERLQYLYKILDNAEAYYKCEFDVIIDTNNIESESGIYSMLNDETLCLLNNVEFIEHIKLTHPFHLTWCHRKHIKDNIDNYENFMYVEGDMLIPYENYLNYLENFKMLYPNYVPSFVRIEENNGEQFITDATEKQSLEIINIGNKQFANLKSPYHAFWIMPAKELKETMRKDFVRLHDSREHAASYPMWELDKTPLVEIENRQISKKCYSYHLPNNYALSKESPYAKIKPENLFI